MDFIKEKIDDIFGGELNLTHREYNFLWRWFGEDKISDDKEQNWVKIIKTLMVHPHFFPFCSKEKAVEILKNIDVKYIIRLSSSLPGHISVTYKKILTKKIVHIRFQIIDKYLSWNPKNERCKIICNDLDSWIRQISMF